MEEFLWRCGEGRDPIPSQLLRGWEARGVPSHVFPSHEAAPAPRVPWQSLSQGSNSMVPSWSSSLAFGCQAQPGLGDGNGKNAGKELQERAESWIKEVKCPWELFVARRIRQWRGWRGVQVAPGRLDPQG